MLVGMEAQELAQSALVPVVETKARDHLRDGEAGAVTPGLQTHEPVTDPRQGREQHAVGDLHVADPEGACQGRLHVPMSSTRLGCPQNQAFSSWIRRNPRSVSRGSTSSIVSQWGAIVAARPPVAMKLACSPSSSARRRLIPSTRPANP